MKTVRMIKVIGTFLVPMLFLTLFLSISFSATVYATEQSSSDISSGNSSSEDTTLGESSSEEQITYTIVSLDNAFLNTISTAKVNIIQNTSGDIDDLLYFVYPNLCSVVATVQPSDGTESFTKSLTVKWDCIYSTTTVNPAVVGTYTEHGTIELPGAGYVWGEGVSQTVSIPVNVIIPDEPILLTSTSYIPSNAYSLTVGEDLSEITDLLYPSVVCYTDDNKAHPVDIIWNTDNVDTETVGVYTITGILGDAPLHHVFSDDLQQTTFTTTVSVQEEGKPNINCIYSSYGVIYFPWEMSEEMLESVQVWLQKDDGEWTLLSVDNYDVDYSAEYLMLYMDILVEGCDYRLQVDYEGGQTSIFSFHYSEDGMPTMSSVVDGDRDGGDTEGNTTTSTEDRKNVADSGNTYSSDTDTTPNNSDSSNSANQTDTNASEDSNNGNSDSNNNTDTNTTPNDSDNSDSSNNTTPEDSNNSNSSNNTTPEDSNNGNADSSNRTDTDNDNNSKNIKNNSSKNKDKKNTDEKNTSSNQENTNGNQNSNNGTSSNTDTDDSAGKESERSTAVSSAINAITTEQDTEAHSSTEQDEASTDVTTITGAELRLMLETSDVARFSCNGITVNCSATSLDALGISDQDVLEISIVPDGKGGFTLSISLNGTSITELVGMEIMIPFTATSDSPALSLIDANGTLITTGTYDCTKNLATFIIDQTGYYSIADENALDNTTTNPILTFIIVFLVVAIMLLICFVVYTIRRKHV